MNINKNPRRVQKAVLLAALLVAAVALSLPDNALTQSSFWASNGDKIYNTNSGNVGIGTQNPNFTLEVARATSGIAEIRVKQTIDDGSSFASLSLQSGGDQNGTAIITVGDNYTNIPGFSDTGLFYTGSTVSNGLAFVTTEPNAPIKFITGGLNINNERMRITNVGNIGIGTTAPATKLHVVGDLTVTGNIAAKYQDFAEWVPARRAMPAGTVVIIDPGESNQVVASWKAYDTRVAGVISAKPGVVLGDRGEGKVMVATSGRVKVKVDATQAPISVGDLLVTGAKEGVAMKSQPIDVNGTQIHRPGTLIGKALESLSKGEGEILVLLSLQ